MGYKLSYIPQAYCMLGLLACSEAYEFLQLGLGCPGSGNILFQRRMSFFLS